MNKISQHDQLIAMFIAFIVSFAILMTIIVFKWYQEQIRERIAIEGIFRDINFVEYQKHMKNYE